jgi:hypothetical protein
MGVRMQKAKASHGQPKMDTMMGRRELSCVRLVRSLYMRANRSWCGANVDGKKKSGDESNKEQIKRLAGKFRL